MDIHTYILYIRIYSHSYILVFNRILHTVLNILFLQKTATTTTITTTNIVRITTTTTTTTTIVTILTIIKFVEVVYL